MFWSNNNNGYGEGKFLIIDVGAYEIKGKVWGESMSPIVVKSTGFRGYITNPVDLKNSIYNVLEGIKSTYPQEITRLYPFFAVSFKDVEFVQYEESIPCSPKVKREHIYKIKGILENKIRNESQKEILFSEITSYKILNPDNKEMVVDYPEGLSARSLTAQISFLLIPQGIFSDFLETVKGVCSDFGLKKPTVVDSTLALAYGLKEKFENFDLLDMGYTSTRLVRIRGGKLVKFETINFGGINIHLSLEAFGIPNYEVKNVLHDIFIKDKPKIIGGPNNSEIYSNVIEQQIENSLRNVFGRISFSAIPIFVGGFSNLGKKFRELINSAINANIIFLDVDPLDVMGKGISNSFYGKIQTKKGSYAGKEFNFLDSFIDFIKREVLGKED